MKISKEQLINLIHEAMSIEDFFLEDDYLEDDDNKKEDFKSDKEETKKVNKFNPNVLDWDTNPKPKPNDNEIDKIISNIPENKKSTKATMKITEKELRKLIREAVKKKITLLEGNDFTAKRQIIMAAEQTSMSFENEIVKLLDLVSPDEMPAEVQKVYHDVVSQMKENFKATVKQAIEKLSDVRMFPRNRQGE